MGIYLWGGETWREREREEEIFIFMFFTQDKTRITTDERKTNIRPQTQLLNSIRRNSETLLHAVMAIRDANFLFGEY